MPFKGQKEVGKCAIILNTFKFVFAGSYRTISLLSFAHTSIMDFLTITHGTLFLLAQVDLTTISPLWSWYVWNTQVKEMFDVLENLDFILQCDFLGEREAQGKDCTLGKLWGRCLCVQPYHGIQNCFFGFKPNFWNLT